MKQATMDHSQTTSNLTGSSQKNKKKIVGKSSELSNLNNTKASQALIMSTKKINEGGLNFVKRQHNIVQC
uniref:Uncharacterized protein n=1 Tax=Arundo donax TaxID=35708 RepID=A0A0A9EXZ3_ARUDO